MCHHLQRGASGIVPLTSFKIIIVIHKVFIFVVAGWSSSVARWAHNPKVAGSNPAPATTCNTKGHRGITSVAFVFLDPLKCPL